MAIGVNFSSNAKDIQKKFDRLLRRFPKITKQGVTQAGEQLRKIILEKTNKGMRYDAGRFARYSPQYEKLKNKTTVNLQDSNKMLQAIKSRTINNYKAVLQFSNNEMEQRAYYHQTGAGDLPKRPFFGFNKKVENVIKTQFHNFVMKEIRNLKL